MAECHKEQAKVLAEHHAYGRVLILHQVKEGQWSIVRFRPDDGHPVADAFLAAAISFGRTEAQRLHRVR